MAPAPRDRRFLLVANPGAGSAEVVAAARRQLPDSTVETISDDLGSVVDHAIDEGRIVVAAGGDGTVHAVAQHVMGRGTLGVLPAGTLNHFARDLGIDDIETAIRALRDGTARPVDAGRANGEVFVNNVGLGLYPDMVRRRERIEDRIGKWAGMVAAAAATAVRARPLRGTIAADGDRRALSAWIVFVGNNRFSTDAGRMGERERLDGGVLDASVVTADPRRRAGSRAWAVSRGGGFGGRRVRTSAQVVEVELAEERRLAADGEDLGSVRTLEIRIEPGALSVLAP